MRVFRHERFHTYLVAIVLVSRIDAVVASLPKARASLGRRLFKAASRIPVALAVAVSADQGDDDRYREVRRHAASCAALLDLVSSLDLVSPELAGETRETLLDIINAIRRTSPTVASRD